METNWTNWDQGNIGQGLEVKNGHDFGMNHEVYLRFGGANLGCRFNETDFEIFDLFLQQISIKNWLFYDNYERKGVCPSRSKCTC